MSGRLEDAKRGFEERFVQTALVRAGGHRARAADELGVTRQGLTRLLTRLRISEATTGEMSRRCSTCFATNCTRAGHHLR